MLNSNCRLKYLFGEGSICQRNEITDVTFPSADTNKTINTMVEKISDCLKYSLFIEAPKR
jgi:hypothetical protein